MLTEFQRKKWTHLFRMYDTDGDGTVGKRDFELKVANVAKLRGIEAGSNAYQELAGSIMADWEQLRQTADTNADGKVTLDEWLAHGTRVVGDEALYATVLAEADAVVSKFDANGDGKLDRKEFIAIATAWGADQASIEQVFPKLDLHGNGSLSRDDVKTLLTQFHKSNDPGDPGNYFYGDFEAA